MKFQTPQPSIVDRPHQGPCTAYGPGLTHTPL